MSFLSAILLRGVVMAALGLILIAILRRASAANRHLVCVVCLGTMFALPLGLAYAPKRAVPQTAIPFEAIPIQNVVFAPPEVASAPATTQEEPPTSQDIPIESIVVEVWAAGSLLLVLRVGLGWLTIFGWARRSQRFAANVRVSNEINVPLAFWAGRSIVLLPTCHVEWSDERRQAVLLHEFAHVRRGDWAALVLARLTLALHWPNPLAWSLAKAARRAAEDAADDAVLRTGLAPADYAEHLLNLAEKTPFVLALPMAHRPDVDRRIRLILRPERLRGGVTFLTLVLSCLLLGGVFIPAACLVVEQVRPTVGGGKTKPGTVVNGFIGHMSDGRPVEMLQIVRQTPEGLVVWRPDGRPISKSQRITVPLAHNRQLLTILLRFPGQTTDAWNIAERASKTLSDEPKYLLYALGGDRLGTRKGEQEIFSYLGVSDADSSRASLAFPLNDGPWRTEATFSGDTGAKSEAGPLKKIIVAAESTSLPRPVGAKPSPIYDPRISTCVTFKVGPTTGTQKFRLVAKLKNGGQIEQGWRNSRPGTNPAIERRAWFIENAPAEIERFEYQTRALQRVEFVGVHLKPNGR